MTKRFPGFLVLLILAMLAGTVAAEEGALQTYSDAGNKFALEYPATWEVHENASGAGVIILSPLENQDDRFSENINVMVQDLSPQPMTIEEYTELSTDQIAQVLTDGKVIEAKPVTLAGHDGYQLIYAGKQGDFSLKWMCRYAIVDNRVYLVTYTAEEDKFDVYLKDMEQIFASFTLL